MTTGSQLAGPFVLTRQSITQNVPRTSPGAYVLARSDGTAKYVGRADRDLAGRLGDHVGSPYPQFWCKYSATAASAFRDECNLYHEYGEKERLDNEVHPATPDPRLRCPQGPHA